MEILAQKYYGHLEIDIREKDIVQIWNNKDLVQIERKNLQQLITILQNELNKTLRPNA